MAKKPNIKDIYFIDYILFYEYIILRAKESF